MPMTDTEIDEALIRGVTKFVPAGLSGGPTEAGMFHMTPAELVDTARFMLAGARRGAPITAAQADDLRRIIRRARALGVGR